MANYMIVRHSVRDYAAWKIGYDAHEPARAAAGLSEKHLLQDASDPNMITLIFEAQELKRAEEFSHSSDLRAVMQKLGVLSKPDISFLKG